LGDGVCDHPYFNTEEYDYDGGDCCGGTCAGASCGVSGLESVYGIDIASIDFPDFEHDNRVVGYQHCEDPDMATFAIDRTEHFFDWCDVEEHPDLRSLAVHCDDKIYLWIPAIDIGDCNTTYPPYSETFRVPYGTSCEIMMTDMDIYGTIARLELYYVEDMASLLIRSQLDQLGDSIVWNSPASKCIVQTISSYSISIFDESSAQGMTAQTLVDEELSDSMCNQDPELLLERYALTRLGHSLGFESPSLGLHQCYGWGLPDLEILCDENDKVISLLLDFFDNRGAHQGTIPTELSLLSHLGKYNLALYISTLEWRLSFTNVVNLIFLKYVEDLSITNSDLRGQIPSELGNLQSLTKLDLYWNNYLSGQVPSELGNLQSLTELDLSYNALKGQIPSELGNLQSLTELDLSYNAFSGPIPEELYLMTNMERFSLQKNALSGSISPSIANMTTLKEFRVNHNKLQGEVPSELGSLRNLKVAWLHHNDLTGIMPDQICSLGLISLQADCDPEGAAAVECTCCTACCEQGLEYDPYEYSFCAP
jgi:Leucine-rich repeat (LRR) protein